MTEKIATRDAYGKALVNLGAELENLVVLDADLSKSTKTCDFAKAFPRRFVNVGIAEQNLIATAAGLAVAGMIPFASSFAMFAVGRGYEQIRNGVAYPRLNVKIAASHAGITVGEDGASHQMLEDIALMRAIPGMVIEVPADGVETEKAVAALAAWDGPAYLRLGRLAVPVLFDRDSYDFQIGRGVVLAEGTDVVILACGLMVSEALLAAKQLAADGISAAVANMHTIKPLDSELVIRLARQCGAVVSAEEHNIIGGLGSAVAEVLCESAPAPLVRVGIQDTFGESGTPAELMHKYGLSAEHIVAAAKEAVAKKH